MGEPAKAKTRRELQRQNKPVLVPELQPKNLDLKRLSKGQQAERQSLQRELYQLERALMRTRGKKEQNAIWENILDVKQQLKTLLAFAEKPQPEKAEDEDQEPAEADGQERGRGSNDPAPKTLGKKKAVVQKPEEGTQKTKQKKKQRHAREK